jgi:cytoskeletal protein RodZ
MLKEFGKDLKSLREAQNITIAEISAQTRINIKFLNQMEAGIFNFQPETYIRAFLKEYARCIGVSENVLLTDYEKAKSGFYLPKSQKKDETPLTIKPVTETSSTGGEPASKAKEEKSSDEEKKPVPKRDDWPPPEIRRREPDESSKEFSNKSLIQKVLLGLVIIVIILGIIYLIDYLNNSSVENSSNVQPKSFSEMSEDYENKIKGMRSADSNTVKEDSTNVTANDSLELAVVTSKDVRVKVYIDEKRMFEDMIPAKDTVFLSARRQFRFSATGNSSIDLYLNGKYLKKPSSLTGSSIKNLIINKDGIVSKDSENE